LKQDDEDELIRYFKE